MSLALLTDPFSISICCNYFCHWPTISFCCCFLEQDIISHFAISANGIPFMLTTLKCCKNFFSPYAPKLIRNMLHSSPMFTTINVWSVKTPGGGITTHDFKINRFIGLRGIMLLTLFNKLVVKAPEFTKLLQLQSVKCAVIHHLG